MSKAKPTTSIAKPSPTPEDRTDIILSMSHTPTEDYMSMIVTRTKDHEFRTKLYPPTVKRIWFYETSPTSAITYICEIGPTVVRSSHPSEDGVKEILREGAIGNAEFNAYHPDWKGYDFAYPIRSCWRVREPVTLGKMKGYGIGGAPRGMVYVPKGLREDVKWDEQERVW